MSPLTDRLPSPPVDERVRAVAAALVVGKRMSGVARTLNMQMFQFGELTTWRDFTGRDRRHGEAALPIQCPWRIRVGGTVVVGSGDRFRPRDDSSTAAEDFDPSEPGVAMSDQLVERLFSASMESCTVDGVRVFETGDLLVGMTRDVVLEVYEDSQHAERWRIFVPRNASVASLVYPFEPQAG